MRIPFLLGLVIIFQLTACGSSSDEAIPGEVNPDTSGDQTGVVDNAIPDSIVRSDAKFLTDHFAGSDECKICHNNLVDENDTDVSVELDWASTMMANSARDPLFRAKMASETIRNPALKSAIEKKCSRCHTPMANVEAGKKGDVIALLPPGFLSENHNLYNLAMDGVSCSVCHQIEDTPELGTTAGFTGNYSINSEKTIYGPVSDPQGSTMIGTTGFTPMFSGHMSDSKLCSACHNLYTDVVDIETGELTGATFPEQNIYNEWEQSRFADETNGKSCQDCHMPETDGVQISSIGPDVPRDNFSRHYFVGGNTYILDIFNKNREKLGVKANGFEVTLQRTRDMLKSAASLAIVKSSNTEGSLNFTVEIKNLTGHKLPSGYPARRAYLHVTVKNSASEIVFESGALNRDGSIVGVDADINAVEFEKHHNVITTADQVQVYESIMGDTKNQVTYTLLNGSTYLKDNRLLPEGLIKSAATDDVKPGALAIADNNFIAGVDQVDYQIPLESGQAYSVEVELNYQSIAYRYAQDLFTDLDKHEYINTFKTLYDDPTNITYENIAEIKAVIN